VNVKRTTLKDVVRSLISQMQYELRHNGLKATIEKTAQRTREKVYLDHTQVWYELVLETSRPQVPLPSGLRLIRGDHSDLLLLSELPSVHEWLARRRLEAGDELWLVLDGRQPIFACWILRGVNPIRTWGNNRLVLPPNVVCLEDYVTTVSYRGRGLIAPVAWRQIADRLEKTGVETIITDIGKDNKAMRWSIVRAGFREIATVRYRRKGFKQYTTVLGEGATADWLAGQLERRTQDAVGPN
jgi:hypothetical protein